MNTPTATLAFTHTPNPIPRWANLLLVIALGWALAVLSMQLMPSSHLSADARDIATPAELTQNTTSASTIAQITAGLHLFGKSKVAEPIPLPPDPPLPPATTKLKLELTGILAYANTSNAIAIISQGGSEQSVYGIGDTIANGVKILDIQSRFVMIDNRGTRETIPLSSDTPLAQPTNQTPNSTAQSVQNATNEQQRTMPLDIPSDPTDLRKVILKTPTILNRLIAADPFQENGNQVGYTIIPKQNPEILEAIGIYSGDVVTRVNNIQLNSQKQGIRALRNAVKAQTLEVIVLRNGIEVPITIAFSQ